MTTGHERPRGFDRPAWSEWQKTLTTVIVCAAIAASHAVLYGMVKEACRQRDFADAQVNRLDVEITELRAKLDWWECRNVAPEQPGSPTPIEEDHPSIEAEIAAAMPVMPAGVYGSPVQDMRAEYASDFRRGCKVKKAECDHCEGCGITELEIEEQGGQLNEHHVESVKKIFEQGLPHSLIGDPKNLIRLCRNGGCECHFRIGHDEDGPDGLAKPNWQTSNPNVRRDAARNLRKTQVGL